MKIDQVIRQRDENTFADTELHRVVDIELIRDGEPVEIIESTAESVTAELPFEVVKIEEYLNREGSCVYRGEGKMNGERVFFWVEKIF